MNVIGVFVGGNQFYDGFAMFRNDKGLSLCLNFIHHGKTVDFESTRRHGFHPCTVL